MKYSVRNLAPYMLAVAVVFFHLPGHAGNKRLVLATEPDGWPPFSIPAKGSLDYFGIMPDVLREVCAKHGVELDISPLPEIRSRALLAEGKLDAYSLSRKWVDNPSNYLWTAPVLFVQDTLVYRKDTPIRFTTPKDLANLNIGVIHGYVYPGLDTLFEAGIIHKRSTFNTQSLLHMLAKRHVDAIVTTPRVVEWIIRIDPKLQAKDFAFCQKPVDSAPYGFAFAKGKNWEPFITKFNAELEEMRRDGRLDTILRRYR